MARSKSLTRTNGYVVIAVPETGLFVKCGEIVTGDGSPMHVSELILFTRHEDAKHHSEAQERYWKDRAPAWQFPVIPVLVSERV